MALKVILDVTVELVCHLGSDVANGAIDKLEACLDGSLADILDLVGLLGSLNVRICTELQVDPVGIIDHILHAVGTQKVGQIAAHLIAERELAVRERAGSRKARGNVAIGLAVDAIARLGLGTGAIVHRASLLQDQNFSFGSLSEHLQRRKNTGRACTDDHDIKLFHTYFLSFP